MGRHQERDAFQETGANGLSAQELTAYLIYGLVLLQAAITVQAQAGIFEDTEKSS